MGDELLQETWIKIPKSFEREASAAPCIDLRLSLQYSCAEGKLV